MHPIRISPSLLSSDFVRLADEVARVEAAGADWLHLDVMDGHFVPNLTFGPPVIKALKKVATRPLDVHLMISDPWSLADAFLDAGADLFTFHVEVLDRGDGHELIRKVKQRGVRVGMSLNPDADVSRLSPFLDELDLVLVMSVFPGFGGQKFIPDVLGKPGAIRELGFQGEISMDGGIGPDTIASSAKSGTNVFVAGSAVFGAPDLAERIRSLRETAEENRA